METQITELYSLTEVLIQYMQGGVFGFPAGSDGRKPGSIPGSGRSPGEGNGNPLQYACLENSMDGGAWWATVHGGHKVSDTTERLHFTLLLWGLGL